MNQENQRTFRLVGAALAMAMVAAPGFALTSPSSDSDANTRALAQRVQGELSALPYYSVFDNLAFRLDSGKVTLYGEATQPVLKFDAERAVNRIPGVRSVSNQIELLPLSRMDDQIRRGVYYAVYAYGPLQRYDAGSQPAIRIIVKNGRVTLIGMVANEMDRKLVFQRASTVPGVFSVTNQLSIEV